MSGGEEMRPSGRKEATKVQKGEGGVSAGAAKRNDDNVERQ